MGCVRTVSLAMVVTFPGGVESWCGALVWSVLVGRSEWPDRFPLETGRSFTDSVSGRGKSLLGRLRCVLEPES